jgi:hypothetical protein
MRCNIGVQTIDIETLANPSVTISEISMINRTTQVYDEDIIPKVNSDNTKPKINKHQITRTLY